MRNVSYHQFTQVPTVQQPRSRFDLSFRYKSAFDSGKLIPFTCLEVLPGDTFDLSVDAFARLTTPIVPFMDNLEMLFEFWFVPNRLTYEKWQKLCGEQDNPGDSIDYLVPQVVAGENGFGFDTQFDYLGIPPDVPGLSVNALPFRAINLIWNKWYRPEQLANSLPVPIDEGPDDPTDDSYTDCKPRMNKLDYFQGALPNPQKGPGVDLPLGSVAPVIGNGIAIGLTDGTNLGSIVSRHPSTSQGYVSIGNKYGEATGTSNTGHPWANEKNLGLTTDPTKSGLVADLSNATAATVNSLRMAFQIQLFLERENLGGSRYNEIIFVMFGVRTGDARLQLPEFLGSGKLPIVISAVPQTSSTDSTTPQGNLAAFGMTKGSPVGFKKSFVEHGYVIGFVTVRAPVQYQQGLDRMWSRRTRYDFYWPLFAHLGEQAVLNKEIYAQGPDTKDDAGNVIDDKVFGYQERFAEYRYGISKITGQMRSTYSQSLDYWHLAPVYDSLPELGEDFRKVNVPMSRVLAVTDKPQFVFDAAVHCYASRAMPLYSTPGRIDHIV